jgi:hypothetical protein
MPRPNAFKPKNHCGFFERARQFNTFGIKAKRQNAKSILKGELKRLRDGH